MKIKKEKTIYLITLIFAVIVFALAWLSPDFTIQKIAMIFVHLGVAGIALYLFKTFDFIGVNFTNEILKRNIAAAIVFLGLCILVAVVVSA